MKLFFPITLVVEYRFGSDVTEIMHERDFTVIWMVLVRKSKIDDKVFSVVLLTSLLTRKQHDQSFTTTFFI